MNEFTKRKGNWYRAVSMVNGYGVGNQGLFPSSGKHFSGSQCLTF